MIIRLIVIALIVLLCCICSFTDIRKGKVRNVFLGAIGIPAVLLNCVSFFYETEIEIGLLFTSVVVPLLIATMLYILKVWAGGDYKLYCVLTLAMPYEIMCKQYNELPVGLLMIGISFAIGYVYLIVESILIYIKNRTPQNSFLKKTVKDFAKYIPLYFFIGILQKFVIVASETVGISVNEWVLLAVVIAGVFLVNRLGVFDNIIVSITIGVLYIVLAFMNIVYLFDVRLLTLWILVLSTYLTRNFVNQFNYQSIECNELQPGMILSFETSYFISNYTDCKYNKLSKENLESRLSKEEVDEIVRYYNNYRDANKLIIIKKVPFAFFISFSTILLIIGCCYYAY